MTEIDIIQQVAEAKCPDCAPSCPFSGGDCYCYPIEHCEGTGLRYPPLSRECDMHGPKKAGLGSPNGMWIVCPDCNIQHCHLCHGSGRIPDVDEGKVISILLATVGFVGFQNLDDGRVCVWLEPNFPDVVYKGATPELAACAALLGTEE